MIVARRAHERGHFDHGWLDAYHTFSFADYFDPAFVQFGPLRVLNQDRVMPAQGFPTHAHRDMEIVTYVLEGELRHQDSMGNGSLVANGDVQFMSAASGVTHSEFNASKSGVLELLQMWIVPRRSGGTPRYDQKSFAPSARRGRLCLVVSPDGRENSIRIGQDASLYAGLLDGRESIRQAADPGRAAWLHVARGALELNGVALEAGDGAAIVEESQWQLENGREAEFVLWDLAHGALWSKVTR